MVTRLFVVRPLLLNCNVALPFVRLSVFPVEVTLKGTNRLAAVLLNPALCVPATLMPMPVVGVVL